MSDRHRSTRRPHSAPIAPAFAGGLSWVALGLTLLTASGCPSDGATTQDAAPTKVTNAAVPRVPSCEGDLAAVARTLEGNRGGWTPGRGIVPDFSGYVAAALWKSCDLPQGARVLLTHTVTLPKPPWKVAGTPKPANAQEPAEVAMPGFGAVKALGSEGREALAEFQRTVCPARDAVAKDVASAPADQRSAQVFDRCGLSDGAPLGRDAFVAAGLGLDGVGFVALHGWLLEAKIDASVATALVDTLATERPARLSAAAVFAPPPALRLPPVAHGLPPRDGSIVYVGPQALRVNDQAIAKLPSDGSVAALLRSGALGSLEEHVGDRMPPGGDTVILAIDRSTVWPVAAVVVASIAKAGAREIDALVLGPTLQDALRRVPLAQASAVAPFGVDLRLGDSEATVACGEQSSSVAYSSVASALDSCPSEASALVTVTGTPKLRDVLDALDGLGSRPRTLRSSTPPPPT